MNSEDAFLGFFRVSRSLLGDTDTKDMFALYNLHNKKEIFICQKPSGYIKDGEKYVVKTEDGTHYIGTVKKNDEYLWFTGSSFAPFILDDDSVKQLFIARIIKVFNQGK